MSMLPIGIEMSQEEREPLIFRSFRDQKDTTPATIRSRACWTIYLAVTLERLAWYSVIVNLAMFLIKSPLCWPSYFAMSTQLATTGVMYIVGLLGGWLSDSYFGHYSMIVTGYIIYFLGYTLFFSATFFIPPSDSWSFEGMVCNKTDSGILISSPDIRDRTISSIIFSSLMIIGLGAGLVRTNLIPFGGDQIFENGSTETRLFFTRYYWAINLGCLFAVGGVSFIDQYSFFYGHGLAWIALIASLLFFVAGTGIYRRRPAGAGNVITNVFKIIQNAKMVKEESPGLVLDHFLDYANMEYEGGEFNVNQITDVRQLGKVFLVFLLTVPYWICYSQMNGSVFLMQGLHLRVYPTDHMTCHSENNSCSHLSDLVTNNICKDYYMYAAGRDFRINKVTVPGSTLSIFNNIFILVAVPFVQKLYGFLAYNNIKVYTWRRMLAGMLLAVAALLAAGFLETARLWDTCNCGFTLQNIDGRVYPASPTISIWWQVPQYILVGASETFMILTAMEFAYVEAPRNMQGIVMGALWCAAGLGDFIGLSLPYVFYALDIWADLTNINCMRLDISLYILALFLIMFSILFAYIAKQHDLSLSKVIIDRPERQRSLGEISRYRSLDSSNSNPYDYLDDSYDYSYSYKDRPREMM
ncbi:solute carrier family 15 member 4-like [Watersipora subatra]|uniref:solute carrier family 15 member 4-like n=1 Tax=Watersipora subatra TaxID=2589382 RepID=UPI00355AF415